MNLSILNNSDIFISSGGNTEQVMQVTRELTRGIFFNIWIDLNFKSMQVSTVWIKIKLRDVITSKGRDALKLLLHPSVGPRQQDSDS